MTTNKREEALRLLYKQLREAKIAYGHAESKPNVKREELDNLERKISVIDWMIPLVIKAEDEETHTHNPEDCLYFTRNCYSGAGCLGTREVDPCEGKGCSMWKPKEES